MTATFVTLPDGLSLHRVEDPGTLEERFELRLVERAGESGPRTLASLRPATASALAGAILGLSGGRVLPFPSRPAPEPSGGAA